jgi:putative phosphoesterase
VELAILSDTHLPRGARRLPARCVELLRAADLIVHAGDFITLAALDELRGYGKLVGVHGNVDDDGVRAALPETTTIDAGGTRLALIHDAGPARGRITRLRARFPDADAVVFGHSHMPLHEQAADGFQIFNPGSPTERRRAAHHTMGIARTGPAGLTFELVTLSS